LQLIHFLSTFLLCCLITHNDGLHSTHFFNTFLTLPDIFLQYYARWCSIGNACWELYTVEHGLRPDDGRMLEGSPSANDGGFSTFVSDTLRNGPYRSFVSNLLVPNKTKQNNTVTIQLEVCPMNYY